MTRGRISLIAFAALLLAPALAWAAGGGDFDETQTLAAQHLGAFAAGFLTSLTPCVYPMIPIVVGVFGARDEAVNRRKAFVLASCYVLGMAVVYSALGVAFALAGQGSAGQLLSNPWVVLPVVALYLALAVSMFGFFEIQLPYSLQQRLNTVGGAGFGGAFFLGMVGGLTAAPCVGPTVFGILGYVAKNGDAFGGLTLMLAYSLGFGVCFFGVAVFALSLPKSGTWMDTVKSVLGVALIVVSAYFLRPVVPALARFTDVATTFLIGSLALAALGFAIGAAHKSFHGPTSEKIRKGLGVALASVGLIGAMNWNLTPKNPLAWRTDETAAVAEAKNAGKGLIVDFRADWCGPCVQFETDTFSDPLVHVAIDERFVPLKIDMSEQSDEALAIAKKYDAGTLPDVVVLNARGEELDRFRSFAPAGEFLDRLRAVRVD